MQFENGLKRNFALSNGHKDNTDAVEINQPETDTTPLELPKGMFLYQLSQQTCPVSPVSCVEMYVHIFSSGGHPRTTDRCPPPPDTSVVTTKSRRTKKRSSNTPTPTNKNMKTEEKEKAKVKAKEGGEVELDDSTTVSALQSYMDEMVSYPPLPATEGVLKGFPSLGNQTSTSHPDLAFLSGVTNSHLDIAGSYSSDELNRSSMVSKRNEKGAAPLPIIDDSADDVHENVFLTGFHLKPQFSMQVDEQHPHEDMRSTADDEEERDAAREAAGELQTRHEISKQLRQLYRRYPPPLAGHMVCDGDLLVDNIINKFNDLHPPHQDTRGVQPNPNNNHNDLFRDPLPSAITKSGDEAHSLITQESPLPLTAKPVMLDENVVTFRQRTAPSRNYIAPDPTKRPPPVSTTEPFTRPPLNPTPTPAVLDPPIITTEDGATVPNPRRLNRGPEESTYKTLSAKRPSSSSGQSFKSPRAGKAIKATSHAKVYISNEVDENSTLSKMMEVTNQLLESKAKMLRHLHTSPSLKMTSRLKSESNQDPPAPPDCTTIELKLAL